MTVHDELSVITSCGSPDGSAELAQVELAYQQRDILRTALEDIASIGCMGQNAMRRKCRQGAECPPCMAANGLSLSRDASGRGRP